MAGCAAVDYRTIPVPPDHLRTAGTGHVVIDTPRGLPDSFQTIKASAASCYFHAFRAVSPPAVMLLLHGERYVDGHIDADGRSAEVVIGIRSNTMRPTPFVLYDLRATANGTRISVTYDSARIDFQRTAANMPTVWLNGRPEACEVD
jgi:hypothetical protein